MAKNPPLVSESTAVLEVLDPAAEIAENVITPAPRHTDLSGKKIGLFWNTKPGGDIALARVGELLAERFPGIRFENFFFRYPAKPDDFRKLWAGRCDAVVGTTGD